MRRNALNALRSTLETHGEILPLATNDGHELFVLNARVVVDALDRERSEIEAIEDTDIVYVRQPVFIETAIGSVEIFRAHVGLGTVYFTDRFVDRVKAARLEGTEFVPVWHSGS